jgi:hypothetical protein
MLTPAVDARWRPIRKCVEDLSLPPNLPDYEAARRSPGTTHAPCSTGCPAAEA